MTQGHSVCRYLCTVHRTAGVTAQRDTSEFRRPPTAKNQCLMPRWCCSSKSCRSQYLRMTGPVRCGRKNGQGYDRVGPRPSCTATATVSAASTPASSGVVMYQADHPYHQVRRCQVLPIVLYNTTYRRKYSGESALAPTQC